jgi:hypothetical protein
LARRFRSWGASINHGKCVRIFIKSLATHSRSNVNFFFSDSDVTQHSSLQHSSRFLRRNSSNFNVIILRLEDDRRSSALRLLVLTSSTHTLGIYIYIDLFAQSKRN